MEWKKEQYLVSTDKGKLDVGMIHHFLYTTAYWAVGRPMSIMRKSIDNSLCFGLYDDGQQVGFARVVTDLATFGWVCDVFLLPSHRGQGLGKWLIECIVNHPEVKNLRRLVLSSRDSREFYNKFGGFQALHYPDNWMEKFTDAPFRKPVTSEPAK
jgi:GNAT superfamily N-acetyltransferase